MTPLFDFGDIDHEWEWLKYLDDNGYLVSTVHAPAPCTCEQPQAEYSEQVGAAVCMRCGGIVKDNVMRDSK